MNNAIFCQEKLSADDNTLKHRRKVCFTWYASNHASTNANEMNCEKQMNERMWNIFENNNYT